MNVLSIYRSVPANTGPFAATPSPALVVPIRLPGPFILGIQVLTSDQLDTHIRLLVQPSQRVFPDPSAQVYALGTNLAEDGWFHAANADLIPLRIVLPGVGALPEGSIEIGNKDAATAADMTINLLVAARPPDATSLELLLEMKQGLDRWPRDFRDLLRELSASMMERQSLPR